MATRRAVQVLLLTVVLGACGQEPGSPRLNEAAPETPPDRKGPPNILLIVADDMGYTDLGSFGGEIPTPNLDRLALEGVRFTNFHATPMCSPSRAALLTGVDHHVAGFGNMLEELAPNQRGRPGYEGHLNDRVVTVASLLQDAGYRTYLSGKWHLGSNQTARPTRRGFDRAFYLDSGGASHFDDMRPAYAPSPDIKANYWEGEVRLSRLPDDFEYSSQYYVDRLIGYFEEDERPDQPFFAALFFTAPHWPLQAPAEAIERQRGRYDAGYDDLAAARLEAAKAQGVIARYAQRNPPAPGQRPWSELDADSRRVAARAMEIYAAMIAEMDRHTGRLLNYLAAEGLTEDTVVVFLSDNGPEGHDLDETWPADLFPDIRQTIDASHDFSYEAMGGPGSYVLYGPGWADAGSPAFRLHKGFPTEGGTRVTAFINVPGRDDMRSLADAYVSVTDIAPTLLELAGVTPPDGRYRDSPVATIEGRSLLPLLSGEPEPDKSRIAASELLGKRAVRSGRWKALNMSEPWGNGDWQLFDLETDLAESRDMAAEHPEKVAELAAAWTRYAERHGVILPDWVSGY